MLIILFIPKCVLYKNYAYIRKQMKSRVNVYCLIWVQSCEGPWCLRPMRMAVLLSSGSQKWQSIHLVSIQMLIQYTEINCSFFSRCLQQNWSLTDAPILSSLWLTNLCTEHNTCAEFPHHRVGTLHPSKHQILIPNSLYVCLPFLNCHFHSHITLIRFSGPSQGCSNLQTYFCH